MQVYGLDFETYSSVNLPVEGLANYVNDPYFRVLLAAVSRTSDDPDYSAETIVIDFTEDYDKAKAKLALLLEDEFIIAHNAMFEYSVLRALGIDVPTTKFIDSAVVASVAGVGRSLEAAAPQALNVDKLASGKEGIQLFCIPGTYQMENGSDEFDPQVIDDHPEEWAKFKEYCAMDAALSLTIGTQMAALMHDSEPVWSALTMQMNSTGWPVDLPLVEKMHERYMDNVDREVTAFKEANDAEDLNLNSHKQLVEWCKARGVNLKSFDEQAVAKTIDRITKKLEQVGEDDERAAGYHQVLALLRTKQTLGGSSLKKLQTIMNQVHMDSTGQPRLYDSYLHAGAGTTGRTSGRGVQMQNLHRLNGKPDDMSELFDPRNHWSNDKLARNLRQVFTSSDPLGMLIVGDYKAVESRGLAWWAGEEWKLEAYRQGKDVYLLQAAEFYGLKVEDTGDEERRFGKLGELAGGYMAGPGAVRDFSEKLGMPITDGEAAKVVADFRRVNPKTVQFWQALQDALDEAMEIGLSTVTVPHGTIEFNTGPCIDSLHAQVGKPEDYRTLLINVKIPTKDDPFEFNRIFHGVYRMGRGFYYHKPSARKTGDLWLSEYVDPKTKQKRKHSLYGGKLAGVLTQSLCRQIFMEGMTQFGLWQSHATNVHMIGQFHDELVVDWVPQKRVTDPSLGTTVDMLTSVMSTTSLPGFPLACEVKYSYRYTK